MMISLTKGVILYPHNTLVRRSKNPDNNDDDHSYFDDLPEGEDL